jgi:hypothetical protein
MRLILVFLWIAYAILGKGNHVCKNSCPPVNIFSPCSQSVRQYPTYGKTSENPL